MVGDAQRGAAQVWGAGRGRPCKPAAAAGGRRRLPLPAATTAQQAWCAPGRDPPPGLPAPLPGTQPARHAPPLPTCSDTSSREVPAKLDSMPSGDPGDSGVAAAGVVSGVAVEPFASCRRAGRRPGERRHHDGMHTEQLLGESLAGNRLPQVAAPPVAHKRTAAPTCLGMGRWLQVALMTSMARCWSSVSTALCSQMLACKRANSTVGWPGGWREAGGGLGRVQACPSAAAWRSGSMRLHA